VIISPKRIENFPEEKMTAKGPPWYVPLASCVTAAAAAGAFYAWQEIVYGPCTPPTLSPVWQLATFRRWWEWPREAAPGDPVILNPIRYCRDATSRETGNKDNYE
jgi:hypothetical protein